MINERQDLPLFAARCQRSLMMLLPAAARFFCWSVNAKNRSYWLQQTFSESTKKVGWTWSGGHNSLHPSSMVCQSRWDGIYGLFGRFWSKAFRHWLALIWANLNSMWVELMELIYSLMWVPSTFDQWESPGNKSRPNKSSALMPAAKRGGGLRIIQTTFWWAIGSHLRSNEMMAHHFLSLLVSS